MKRDWNCIYVSRITDFMDTWGQQFSFYLLLPQCIISLYFLFCFYYLNRVKNCIGTDLDLQEQRYHLNHLILSCSVVKECFGQFYLFFLSIFVWLTKTEIFRSVIKGCWQSLSLWHLSKNCDVSLSCLVSKALFSAQGENGPWWTR